MQGETTKDKAGSLPPSVYTKEQEHFNIIHLDSAESNVTSSDTGNVMVIQPAASNVLNSSSETVEEIGQLDEYETDSDSDNSISEQAELETYFIHRNQVSRSGRIVRAAVRLDL